MSDVAPALGALAAGSVGALEPSLLLYPLYYCLANGALALLIRHRRAVHRRGERVSPSRGLTVRAHSVITP